MIRLSYVVINSYLYVAGRLKTQALRQIGKRFLIFPGTLHYVCFFRMPTNIEITIVSKRSLHFKLV